MTVAPGFAASLVASEPMMAQPVCIEFDYRGRLWVVQYLQYPNPAGLKRVKVDRYHRTVYDKTPEPPPLGPRGADRITIMEDVDGDGAADRAHDFVNGLNLATSAVFGCGGVFVMQAPYLLFYPDRNEDDVPDSDPEVLLSGFGIEDAQSFANSLIWGPDGWLYGCQGSTVTAKVRGLEFQQAIWRYHPVSRRFELFTEGGGNMWGLDYDRNGDFFASTNGGGGVPDWSIDTAPPFPGKFFSYRMIHMVQGGYYAKGWAKHGALHNAHTYGYFERMPGRDYKGFHVTPGGTIYQGDTFPAEFRGRFIANNLLGHDVQWSDFEPWGTTFKTGYGGDLMVANDTWFAPSDMTTGPDGAVYVADWSDQRTGHPNPDADWDRTNGRVYRIQWGGATAAKSAVASMQTVLNGAASMTKLATALLVELLEHPNNWIVRKARRVLTDRRDATAYPKLRELVSQQADAQISLEALWALYGSGGADETFLSGLLEHPSPRIRRWAVRLLGDQETISGTAESALVKLAGSEADAVVRSQLASTAARLTPKAGLPITHQLVLRDLDADDPYIPLLLWWAVERHSVTAIPTTLSTYNTPAVWGSALARRSILPRLVRRYAAEGTGPALQACAAILDGQPLGSDRSPFVAALEAGLRQRAATQRVSKLDELPAPLLKQVLAWWSDTTRDETLIRLLSWLGHEPARNRALVLASDPASPPPVRIAMMRVLADPARAEDTAWFLRQFAHAEFDEIKGAALEALQQFDSDSVAEELLREYPKLGASLRAKVRSALLTRPKGARALLKRVDAGAIPAGEILQREVRQVEQFADRQLDALVRKHWGRITSTPESRLADVHRFDTDVRMDRSNPPGDIGNGQKLFQQFCGACHVLFGEGGKIGPELTAANRKDREFLLVSLIDPSAVIRKEFLNYTVKTNDGRVVNGFLAGEDAGGVTIGSASNERTTIAREKIVSMEDSGVSLMPEGLLHALTPQQVRDLFAYLQADSPPATSR